MGNGSSVNIYNPYQQMKPQQSALESFAMALKKSQDANAMTVDPLQMQVYQGQGMTPNQLPTWADQANQRGYTNFLNLRQPDNFGITKVI